MMPCFWVGIEWIQPSLLVATDGAVAPRVCKLIPFALDKVQPSMSENNIVEGYSAFCSGVPETLQCVIHALVETVIWTVIIWLGPHGCVTWQKEGEDSVFHEESESRDYTTILPVGLHDNHSK